MICLLLSRALTASVLVRLGTNVRLIWKYLSFWSYIIIQLSPFVLQLGRCLPCVLRIAEPLPEQMASSKMFVSIAAHHLERPTDEYLLLVCCVRELVSGM